MIENTIQLSIVIPFFNEEENLIPVIRESISVLDASCLKGCYQLVLVDDGSTDNSQHIADNLVLDYPCIILKHHEANRGFGFALQTGFLSATGRLVTFIPADGEVKVQEVIKFYERIGEADLLVSKRVCGDRETKQQVRPWYREVLTWGNGVLTRFILGFNPKDMQGIFVVKNEILQWVASHSRCGLVYLEVIRYCIMNQYQLAVGDMYVSPRLHDKSKVANARSILRTLFNLLRLSWSKVPSNHLKQAGKLGRV